MTPTSPTTKSISNATYATNEPYDIGTIQKSYLWKSIGGKTDGPLEVNPEEKDYLMAIVDKAFQGKEEFKILFEIRRTYLSLISRKYYLRLNFRDGTPWVGTSLSECREMMESISGPIVVIGRSHKDKGSVTLHEWKVNTTQLGYGRYVVSCRNGDLTCQKLNGKECSEYKKNRKQSWYTNTHDIEEEKGRKRTKTTQACVHYCRHVLFVSRYVVLRDNEEDVWRLKCDDLRPYLTKEVFDVFGYETLKQPICMITWCQLCKGRILKCNLHDGMDRCPHCNGKCHKNISYYRIMDNGSVEELELGTEIILDQEKTTSLSHHGMKFISEDMSVEKLTSALGVNTNSYPIDHGLEVDHPTDIVLSQLMGYVGNNDESIYENIFLPDSKFLLALLQDQDETLNALDKLVCRFHLCLSPLLIEEVRTRIQSSNQEEPSHSTCQCKGNPFFAEGSLELLEDCILELTSKLEEGHRLVFHGSASSAWLEWEKTCYYAHPAVRQSRHGDFHYDELYFYVQETVTGALYWGWKRCGSDADCVALSIFSFHPHDFNSLVFLGTSDAWKNCIQIYRTPLGSEVIKQRGIKVIEGKICKNPYVNNRELYDELGPISTTNGNVYPGNQICIKAEWAMEKCLSFKGVFFFPKSTLDAYFR